MRALLARPPRWLLLVVAVLGVVSVLASVRLAWVQELVGICRVGLGAALRAPGRRWPVASPGAVSAVALGVAGVAVWLEPVRVTIGYGQVNLLLALAVLVDCLLVPPRWRGHLTGIAASVKLTPAVFLLLFGATGQRGAALRTVTSGAAATLVAVVLAPGSSWRFWTSTVWSNTAGPPWLTANQSLRGASERLLMKQTPSGELTALATVAVLVVGAVAIRRCWLAGWEVSAVAACGVVGLLVSPVSWSHHWVWVVPLVLGLVLEVRTRRSRRLAWSVVVLTSVAPQWFLPQWRDRELGWAWWMNVVGNSYVYVGLAVLVVLATSNGARPSVAEWDLRQVGQGVDQHGCPRQESNLRPSD